MTARNQTIPKLTVASSTTGEAELGEPQFVTAGA
jgi:hypothetical protein